MTLSSFRSILSRMRAWTSRGNFCLTGPRHALDALASPVRRAILEVHMAREKPWILKTPSGQSEFQAFRDEALDRRRWW
jgi:hypothetical protein